MKQTRIEKSTVYQQQILKTKLVLKQFEDTELNFVKSKPNIGSSNTMKESHKNVTLNSTIILVSDYIFLKIIESKFFQVYFGSNIKKKQYDIATAVSLHFKVL